MTSGALGEQVIGPSSSAQAKVVTILGARPQFVKAGALSRGLRANFDQIEEVIVHTGQHYDSSMSDVFFSELRLQTPKYHLGVGGGTHGAMTGRMLEKIEQVLLTESPDLVLVYGDTNSTLAGALAASKLHVPIAHVEAGLRSFNMRMPEEVNRILTDRISDLLFCPTPVSKRNLANEGQPNGIVVGDVMLDVALQVSDLLRKEEPEFLEGLSRNDQYILVTCHRADTVDSRLNLEEVVAALEKLSREMKVVFPVHPRTRSKLNEFGLSDRLNRVWLLDPQPYMRMVDLESNAAAILTDSGGVQKEAYFFGVPCITFRSETEWVETVDSGWNRLVAVNAESIYEAVVASVNGTKPSERPNFYGTGTSSLEIGTHISRFMGLS